MSWFKNPWLADKGSNPWAESNPWAQGKPEFQKAIGQSLKGDDTPIKADNAPDDFTTGYWLDEKTNTIVFSCYVYNATKHLDKDIEIFFDEVIAIQRNFSTKIGTKLYAFEFLPKWVSKPRYDYWNIYGNSKEVNNPKIKPYILKKENTRSQTDLKVYFGESNKSI